MFKFLDLEGVILLKTEKHNTNKGKKLNVQPIRKKGDIEIARFLLSKNKFGRRDVLLFLFGINTGLRASDIVVRKAGEFRHTKHPLITERKTGKRRELNVTNLSDMIDDYIKNLDDDDYLFQSNKYHNYHLTVNGVYQIMRKLGEQMNRSDFGTHTMRKTFGYHYYKQTHDIATLMEIFNHSSQQITKRYIGITQDEINESLNEFKLGLG